MRKVSALDVIVGSVLLLTFSYVFLDAVGWVGSKAEARKQEELKEKLAARYNSPEEVAKREAAKKQKEQEAEAAKTKKHEEALAAEAARKQRQPEDLNLARSELAKGDPYAARVTVAPHLVDSQEARSIEARALAAIKKLEAESDRLLKAAKKREGIHIGMTKQQVLDSSWGRPRDRSSTTTVFGTTEIWLYESGSFLYFDESGRLSQIHK